MKIALNTWRAPSVGVSAPAGTEDDHTSPTGPAPGVVLVLVSTCAIVLALAIAGGAFGLVGIKAQVGQGQDQRSSAGTDVSHPAGGDVSRTHRGDVSREVLGDGSGEESRSESSSRGLYAATIARPAAPALPIGHRRALAGHVTGINAARSAAGKSPEAATKLERDFAADVEEARNRAMRFLARSSRGQLADRARVIKRIQRAGVGFATEQPLADAVVIRATAAEVARVRAIAGVTSVSAFEQPQPMAYVIDGSPTWHAEGYSGQAGNPDLPLSTDGPDVVVWDQGISTGHNIFRSRQSSDCATCLGTGASQDRGPGDAPRAAAGPHTRVYSPSSRTNFDGSKHGNVVAASIAATDFTLGNGWGKGIAYGIDKLYDVRPSQPISSGCYGDQWLAGIDCGTDPGVPDLPEVWNYSAGDYQDTTAFDPRWLPYDERVQASSITSVISAGNCGKANSTFTGCNAATPDITHRVSAPANLHNVISVGGLNPVDPGDYASWRVWENSSPGPTWDGRKKPDLIATTSGNIIHAQTWDADTNGKLDDYGNNGSGTSYAAPQVTAAAALLASIGVYSPMAQRAILINSARPIQNQTYWTPTSGWGALDLAAAFPDRGNYRMGSVGGVGINGARFFALTGVAPGDRATLAWNRRVWRLPASGGLAAGPPNYNALTNLDLSQISPANPAGTSLTATGGSDAAENVDSNPTASGTPGNNAATDNPMPGSGQDAGDNIEQIRSTASGNQILKVKALSTVDGAGSEPFAIASSSAIAALETPIPVVAATPNVALAQTGAEVSITVQVSNPSSDLPLGDASASLDPLPAGVVAVGSTSASLGTVLPGGSASTTFTLRGDTDGAKEVSVTAAGTTYGEPFGDSEEATITFDGTPPEVTLDALPEWSTTGTPTATWIASDAITDVASYDVETRAGDGAWTRVVDAAIATSAQLGAPEGVSAAVRVRARDTLGHTSDWSEASTTIDAVEPAINFGAASYPAVGTIQVPVSVTNVGAPIVAKSYAPYPTAPPLALTGNLVTFVNPSRYTVSSAFTVTATDATGRSVSRSQGYMVPPKSSTGTVKKSTRLKLAKLKVRIRKVTVSGSIAPKLSGRVTLTISPKSKGASQQFQKTLRLRNGKFRYSKKLKRGKYSVKVRFAGSASRKSTSVARGLRVR